MKENRTFTTKVFSKIYINNRDNSTILTASKSHPHLFPLSSYFFSTEAIAFKIPLPSIPLSTIVLYKIYTPVYLWTPNCWSRLQSALVAGKLTSRLGSCFHLARMPTQPFLAYSGVYRGGLGAGLTLNAITPPEKSRIRWSGSPPPGYATLV